MADPAGTLNFHNYRHFPSGINEYVPKLTGAAEIDRDGSGIFRFGVLDVADTAGVLAALTAVGATYLPSAFVTGKAGQSLGVVAARWGRDITAVASGAGTNNVVTINGRDYLGQKVVKAQGTERCYSNQLWCGIQVHRQHRGLASGGSITVQVGYGAAFGLPFRVSEVVKEYADGVVANAGTLTAADLTDPATNATTDPRGLYAPTTTPDGAKEIWIRAVVNAYINSNKNGGLHGIQHYGG
jgi:hypothetical protein